jgi:hypothetical protein
MIITQDMKAILTLLPLFFLTSSAFSQTTAVDYTGNDCSGIPHHFFSELDSGHVLVIDYIMLSCSPCIIGTNALKTLTAQFEQSHPGRVRLYSFGYLDAYTCQQLSIWRSTNNYTHKVFSGGNSQVNYYGGMGMPTIVVLSGNSYSVEYRKLGYSSNDDAAIVAAINKALHYNPLGLGDEGSLEQIQIAQEGGTLSVTNSEPLRGLVLTDLSGRQVLNIDGEGQTNAQLDVSGLPSGIYLLRLRLINGSEKVSRVFIAKD